MSVVPIALSADANYLPGLEVTRSSMVRSCRAPERLQFHVFRESPELAARIRREFGEYKGSVMAFVRLYLPELMPEADWVVYSDVDTIWNRDVCELYDTVVESAQSEKDAKTVYWVRDAWSTRREAGEWHRRINPDFLTERYGCSGVTVLNLKKMRETALLQRAIEFTKRHGLFTFVDQDILNALCNTDSGLLPGCWDVMGCWESLPVDSRCVYHLTGVGRHFHAKEPPVYPPQYQLWWNVRMGTKDIHVRSRLLAHLWPFRFVLLALPRLMRERVMRQMYFARELAMFVGNGDSER